MSSVPGSLFRKILFWMHLSAGVVAGILILAMSVTGVAMTYERQMIAAAARRNHVAAPQGQARMGVDDLAARARAAHDGDGQLSLVFEAEAGAPVTVTAGRQTAALLNPYTGESIVDASTDTRSFMSTMRSWHRYLGGDARGVGGWLIDYSNLLFVFIIVSGMYLWLPAVWRWRTVRGLVFFQSKYINAKVRDFNWHHVFGIWMLLPLFLIAVSGAVISFPWASNLVYLAFGEEPPQRGGGGGGERAGAVAPRDGRGPGAMRDGEDPSGPGAGTGGAEVAAAPQATLQQLFDATTAQAADWQRITLPVQARGDHIDVQVELKSTERRPPRRTLGLSTADASVINDSGPGVAAQTPAQKARSWFRFVHTGEQYGVIGQTIAGIASLAACFLVYTGLALAWRRLIRPMFRRV
jgi:uncharacterized iron-regulated membrane protein